METLLEGNCSPPIPSSLQQSPKSQHWLWSVRASEGCGDTEAQRGQALSQGCTAGPPESWQSPQPHTPWPPSVWVSICGVPTVCQLPARYDETDRLTDRQGSDRARTWQGFQEGSLEEADGRVELCEAEGRRARLGAASVCAPRGVSWSDS